VQVGIETDRGPWVQALLAAGYVVFAINPLQRLSHESGVSRSGVCLLRLDLWCGFQLLRR
jgi:hypothetical protein